MYTEINTKLKIYISNWLLFMFFLVSAMIVVGGLTRLTDSGLSITEWELFSGLFPPLNHNDWIVYFSLSNDNCWRFNKTHRFRIIDHRMGIF